MLDKYHCSTEDQWICALREIFQEIALQGLWRGGFFEHAAFYGGTALRILYGLKRGSEDLDFSLLGPMEDFRMADYGDAVKRELSSFGFEAEFVSKESIRQKNIESAFLKANTKMQLLSIGMPDDMVELVYGRRELKIKFEVDTNPPGSFGTEVKMLFMPTPHSIRVYTLPCLFAGKLHAVLCRKWRNRVKGRDWYDMVWYAGHFPQVDIAHLEERMRQSGDYTEREPLSLEKLKYLLEETTATIDVDSLKDDVKPFVHDVSELEIWSREFFCQAIDQIKE
ncbi:MAG: nucleotidyl transferase AbiEii/AbiGii toxin family protein [Lentisphaeria bacterium]|nr:nucleotidyl transferase AbiEii/AbiGii toxin family protein [Lentisphaeria bacterium]